MSQTIPLKPSERAMIMARVIELYSEVMRLAIPYLTGTQEDRDRIDRDWPRIRDAMRWNASLLKGNIHVLNLPAIEDRCVWRESGARAVQMEKLGEVIMRERDKREYLREYHNHPNEKPEWLNRNTPQAAQ